MKIWFTWKHTFLSQQFGSGDKSTFAKILLASSSQCESNLLQIQETCWLELIASTIASTPFGDPVWIFTHFHTTYGSVGCCPSEAFAFFFNRLVTAVLIVDPRSNGHVVLQSRGWFSVDPVANLSYLDENKSVHVWWKKIHNFQRFDEAQNVWI